MPRKPRIASESGIYHIILRGINRQCIFEDEEDNVKFSQTLHIYKEISEYSIHAYCLMGNHVHLLMKVGKEPLEQVMRRICGSYVYWYNNKYERIGNLFQDRFKSEPVENDAYFLTVIRYIYQNPVKAGLVKRIEQYKWSNYNDYMSNKKNSDVEFTLDILSNNREEAKKKFVEFISKPNESICLDVEEKHRLKDEEARNIIKNLCKVSVATDLKTFDKLTRNAFLKELKETHNMSIKQIERLTGVNRGIVLKV